MKKIAPYLYIGVILGALFFLGNINYFLGNIPSAIIMDDKFIQSVKVILEHEGGMTTDKTDPGGKTNFGVSLRFLRGQGIDVDGDGDSDEDDIEALDKDDAIYIYKKYWWDNYDYSRFNTLHIATKVFDLSVNMGHIPAHKILQRAINRISDKKLLVDGWIGDKTFLAANSLKSIELHKAIRIEAKNYYLSIIASKPKMEKYRTGWLNRAAW
jgi:lysozyme family protein